MESESCSSPEMGERMPALASPSIWGLGCKKWALGFLWGHILGEQKHFFGEGQSSTNLRVPCISQLCSGKWVTAQFQFYLFHKYLSYQQYEISGITLNCTSEKVDSNQLSKCGIDLKKKNLFG